MNLALALSNMSHGLSQWGKIKADQEAQQIAQLRAENFQEQQSKQQAANDAQQEDQRESFQTKRDATQHANRLQEIQTQETTEGKRQKASQERQFAHEDAMQQNSLASSGESRSRADTAANRRALLQQRSAASKAAQAALEQIQKIAAQSGASIGGMPIDVSTPQGLKMAMSNPILKSFAIQYRAAKQAEAQAAAALNGPQYSDFSTAAGLGQRAPLMNQSNLGTSQQATDSTDIAPDDDSDGGSDDGAENPADFYPAVDPPPGTPPTAMNQSGLLPSSWSA